MNLIYTGIFVLGVFGAVMAWRTLLATRRTRDLIALWREPMGLTGHYVVADLHVGCSIADPQSTIECAAHHTRPVVLRVRHIATHATDLFDPAAAGDFFRQSS